MSHFAKIESGIVTQVIVAEQIYIDTLSGTWVQTSYNTIGNTHKLGGTPFRKNFAGIGDTFDSSKDAFYAPQPYSSWTLNNSTCLWEPPVDVPAETEPKKFYEWDEENTNWKEIT
jgi:hypothetical protein